MTEIMGTAFLVHGTWYLRYLDGGGMMIPIDAGADVRAKLRDARMVRVSGNFNSDGRGPTSVHAVDVEIVGSPTA